MSKVIKIRPVGAEFFHAAGQRQTDMKKLTEALKKEKEEKGKKDVSNCVFDPRFIFRCKLQWLFVAFTSSHFQYLRYSMWLVTLSIQ